MKGRGCSPSVMLVTACLALGFAGLDLARALCCLLYRIGRGSERVRWHPDVPSNRAFVGRCIKFLQLRRLAPTISSPMLLSFSVVCLLYPSCIPAAGDFRSTSDMHCAHGNKNMLGERTRVRMARDPTKITSQPNSPQL